MDNLEDKNLDYDILSQISPSLLELFDDIESHNYSLVVSVLQECLSGTDPHKAISIIAQRCKESEEFLLLLVTDALRRQLPKNI